MKKMILPIGILVLALAVTLSGCSLFGAAQASGGASNHSDPLRLDAQQLSYPTAPSTQPQILTQEEALALVQAEFPGQEIILQEAELDDGIYEFDFTVDGVIYDYDVNAYTGEIVKRKVDRDDRVKPAPTPTEPSAAETTPTEPSAPATETAPTTLTLEDAKAIVLEHLGDPGAEFLKTEQDDGKYEFKVRSNGAVYDYEVSIRTGKILEAELEKAAAVQAPAPTVPAENTQLTMDEAKGIVLAHLGDANASFVESELDDDGVYEFEVRSNGVEYDYEVDACTGAVLKVERDD